MKKKISRMTDSGHMKAIQDLNMSFIKGVVVGRKEAAEEIFKIMTSESKDGKTVNVNAKKGWEKCATIINEE